MINIENARPTVRKLLSHLEQFESYCLGEVHFSPSEYREINEELSVGAVLMLGKYRIRTGPHGRKLIWQGLDNREHDLGPVHDPRIMRDYPGFHAGRSRALGNDYVIESRVIKAPRNQGNLTIVTMEDGTEGIGPNYRIALRNAALKMHLKTQFNFASMADVMWKRFWGHA